MFWNLFTGILFFILTFIPQAHAVPVDSNDLENEGGASCTGIATASASDTSIQVGESITLTSSLSSLGGTPSNKTYLWTYNDGSSSSTQLSTSSSATFAPSQNGTYEIYLAISFSCNTNNYMAFDHLTITTVGVYSITQIQSISQVDYYIPLAIHRLQRDDGTGGASRMKIEKRISDLNNAFSSLKIKFYLYELKDIRDIVAYNDTVFNYADSKQTLDDSGIVEGAINILVANDVFVDDDDGRNELGWYSGSNGTITVQQNIKKFVWVHEMGHLLGLNHTSEPGTYMSHYVEGEEAIFTDDQQETMLDILQSSDFQSTYSLVSEEEPSSLVPEVELLTVGSNPYFNDYDTIGEAINNIGSYFNDYDTIGKAINNISLGGTIEISSGKYLENLELDEAEVTLVGKTNKNDKTIYSKVVIDGNRGGAVILISNASNITLQNLTITNGSSNEYGAGLYIAESQVSIANSYITNNYAVRDGGGIYALTSQVTVSDTSFSQNEAGVGDGGGIYALTSQVTVSDTSFSQNESTYGSAIYIESSTVSCTRASFTDNDAIMDYTIVLDDDMDTFSKITSLESTWTGESRVYLRSSYDFYEATTDLSENFSCSTANEECVSL